MLQPNKTTTMNRLHISVRRHRSAHLNIHTASSVTMLYLWNADAIKQICRIDSLLLFARSDHFQKFVVRSFVVETKL
jgi:hypothetical protein